MGVIRSVVPKCRHYFDWLALGGLTANSEAIYKNILESPASFGDKDYRFGYYFLLQVGPAGAR